MLVADAVVLPVLMYLAFALRLGEVALPLSSGLFLLMGLSAVIALPLLYWGGFYRAVVRYLGSEMAWTILVSVTVTSLALSAMVFMLRIDQVPRSVMGIFWALSVLYLGGSRFLVKRYLVRAFYGQEDKIPVAIFGAGGCGVQLSLALSQASIYQPRIFVDDSPALKGMVIQGVRVIGRNALAAALKRYDIETVLLAMPSVSRQRRLDIVNFLETLPVQVKSVPALPDVVAGKARIEDVHDIEIDDLLGRDSVPPDNKLLQRSITGRSVMVTGAGGSIGSELCRQILWQRPAKLVLFEQNEFALYSIEKELLMAMGAMTAKPELVPVLGSVVCELQVRETCREMGVETVFHAAAYKHVPMVEANPLAGAQNNILGTYHTALAAEAAGVERFVLVSTDKAVRSTNVMGATKRFAEIILQGLAERSSNTVFTMVRFGNVLGSSGSVVPLFRRQIEAGGPITLTHREITRYFMTIPEASQLVIQAGAMARGGEVFVLDMGEPVKIYDLASSMIRLMGFSIRDDDNPEGDIAIHVTGLRPGEKLYEELLIGTGSTGTQHPMVMQAHETHLAWQDVQSIIQQIEDSIEERNANQLLALLLRHVSSYKPAHSGAEVVAITPRRQEGA